MSERMTGIQRSELVFTRTVDNQQYIYKRTNGHRTFEALERRGLVEVKYDPRFDYLTRFVLTEQGKRTADRLLVKEWGWTPEMVAALHPNEQQELTDDER